MGAPRRPRLPTRPCPAARPQPLTALPLLSPPAAVRYFLDGETVFGGLPFDELTDPIKSAIKRAIVDALTVDDAPDQFTTTFGRVGRWRRDRARGLDAGDAVCSWAAMYEEEEVRTETEERWNAVTFHEGVLTDLGTDDAMDDIDLTSLTLETEQLVLRESAATPEVEAAAERPARAKGGGMLFVLIMLFVIGVLAVVGYMGGRAKKGSLPSAGTPNHAVAMDASCVWVWHACRTRNCNRTRTRTRTHARTHAAGAMTKNPLGFGRGGRNDDDDDGPGETV